MPSYRDVKVSLNKRCFMHLPVLLCLILECFQQPLVFFFFFFTDLNSTGSTCYRFGKGVSSRVLNCFWWCNSTFHSQFSLESPLSSQSYSSNVECSYSPLHVEPKRKHVKLWAISKMRWAESGGWCNESWNLTFLWMSDYFSCFSLALVFMSISNWIVFSGDYWYLIGILHNIFTKINKIYGFLWQCCQRKKISLI